MIRPGYIDSPKGASHNNDDDDNRSGYCYSSPLRCLRENNRPPSGGRVVHAIKERNATSVLGSSSIVDLDICNHTMLPRWGDRVCWFLADPGCVSPASHASSLSIRIMNPCATSGVPGWTARL